MSSLKSWSCGQIIQRLLTQLDDVLVHLLDGQMQYFPEIHFCEFAGHFLGEYPRGHRRAVDYLQLEQLIDQHHHHLLVRRPELKYVMQYTDLGLLRFGKCSEYRMKF